MTTNGQLVCDACSETPLTCSDVDNIDEDSPVEAMLLGELHHTPTDGLVTLDEIKIRLKLHVKLVTGGSVKDKLDSAIKSIGDKDAERRLRLSQMVADMKSMFTVDHSTTRLAIMERLLNQDGSTTDIRVDCDRRIASLRNNECLILVSGESSAGKSSLLNLLFGEDILPQHMLPCTSAVTVIKYGPVTSANVIYKDRPHVFIPTLDTAGLAQLHNVAFIQEKHGDVNDADDVNIAASVYEKRREGHTIQEIQVFLPLEFLKGGLVLVDTPGVGENEFLESYLMDYIASHTILGFMYIIMADNPLGVAEDRLVNLMSLIIKQQKCSSDLLRFDPNAALFIGNRWDIVEAESKDVKRADILKKLEKCWPEFDKSKAMFFSTWNARREVNKHRGFITDEYEKLLRALLKLVETSVDRRIKTSYKWLGNVLQRSLHYVKTIARQIEMSDQDRKKKEELINRKLKVLTQKSTGVIGQLRRDAEFSVKEICFKLREFLKKPSENKVLLQRWGDKPDELPDLTVGSGNWDWVKRQLDAAFDARLLLLIEDWDKNEQTIPTLQKKLARDARLNMCDLEGDLAEIENKVHGDSLRVSGSIYLSSLCHSLPDFAESALIETTDVPNRMKISLYKFIKKIKPSGKDQKLKTYIKDRPAVARHYAKKNLNALLDERDDKLEWFVRQFMQRPFAYIRSLEVKIPTLIECNEKLLTAFKDEIAQESQCRADYTSMITQIEGLRRGMLEYSEDFLFANDFQNEDVVLVRDKPHPVLKTKESLKDMMKMVNETNSRTAYKNGIWTNVYHGYLKSGGHDCDVAVRLYNRNTGIENTFLEIAKLRCLLHQDVCIAEFLGIYQHIESPYPALIYAGNLLSIQRYRETNTNHNVNNTLSETLAGLQYIHSKGLVHMELSRETLTVSAEHGEVRLTGACLPRLAKFPEDDKSGLRAAGYVYLAPEVLHGHLYSPCADIYAFALLSIELISSTNVFEVDISNSLTDFINTVNAVQKLTGTINRLEVAESTKKMLTACLHGIRETRPEVTLLSMEFKCIDYKQKSTYSTYSLQDSLRESYNVSLGFLGYYKKK